MHAIPRYMKTVTKGEIISVANVHDGTKTLKTEIV